MPIHLITSLDDQTSGNLGRGHQQCEDWPAMLHAPPLYLSNGGPMNDACLPIKHTSASSSCTRSSARSSALRPGGQPGGITPLELLPPNIAPRLAMADRLITPTDRSYIRTADAARTIGKVVQIEHSDAEGFLLLDFLCSKIRL